ncbi:Germinal-center associated nuclear protein [Galemys pyrenaicus]|uniref:Germinal-center associated nuclear protein n=1 Tax=Galemys pyrenaicus TaxID=202257 RepID=A0A8J6A748_GALPY|nr:Germinal-center associated nuclear protein [Galemys pyrenaicus]
MNPASPFGAPPPGGFPPPGSSVGTFQAKAPFRFGQPPLFGQSSPLPAKSAGLAPAPGFAAPSGAIPPAPAHTLGFPQTANVGLFSGLEHTPAFAATSGPPGSSVPANPGFAFKSPSVGAFQSPSPFGPEAGEIANPSFGKTDFGFKPLQNSVFRPILGPESEPEKTQSQIASGFFTFSHPSSSGTGGLAPFSFSQVTSASATSSHFTFPKPVASNTASPVFTASLSSQNSEEEKRGPKSLFGGPGSFASFPGSSSASLGEPFPGGKPGARQGCEEAVPQTEPLPNLMKGLKRKEDQDRSPRRQGHDAAEDPDPLSRGDHPPDKRPVRLNRPRGGSLFGRTIQDVFKSNKEAGRLGSKESKRETGCSESAESDPMAVLGGSPSVLAPSRLPGVNKEEETEIRDKKEDSLRGTPGRPSKRSESTDSLGGLSPAEATAIQCKNIPDYLNDRAVLENHFGKIAKVQRIYTRRSKKLAVVYFFDHASAALARKKGKGLHEDVVIFWHKKKISPNKKSFSLKEIKPGDGEASQGTEETAFPHCSLGKPAARATAGGLPSKRCGRCPVLAVCRPEPLAQDRRGGDSPVKKPGLLKFEGDPFDSGSEGPEGLGPCVSSLSALIGTVAETSEEKYRLLDQRDRVMRQAVRVRRTGLDKARTVVGTCPDMCPEKERYMRETRSQLSVFEVIPGTDQVGLSAPPLSCKETSRFSPRVRACLGAVGGPHLYGPGAGSALSPPCQVDHAAAVKEYSRSSADQEEPLPHELRPAAVLSRTMDHLVTQIMDQKEGSLRDWYDFVWNRTRGIRKDITQQHLCDPVTVSLIERCTRFHIHCAHFMCEEPMSSFDAKINNENMTKCLQSLKEMYQDLRGRGVLCAGEAEFQGYNVLLSLNKGDILREVQQFHPAVRNSAEVRFAVQAFAALNSNNFVRFFKLVQSAPYLSACLLHCYFNQIRRGALRALSVAYTVSTQRAAAFPLEGLVRTLLFRDGEEAADFLSCHGLSVSEGYVELSRTAFLEPEGPCRARKSELISRKLAVSVGEIVHGGPLPPAPRHMPVCSFNSQNKYVGESLAAELPGAAQGAGLDAAGGGGGETGDEADTPLPAPQPLPAPTAAPPSLLPAPSLLPPPELLPAPPTPVFTDASPPSTRCGVLGDGRACTRHRPLTPPQALAQVVDELIREVVQKDLEDVGAAAAAFAATALGVSSAAADELLAATTADLLQHVAAEEVARAQEREAEARRRAEEEQRLEEERERTLAQLSQGLAAELTERVLTECVQEACAQELRSAVEMDRRARVARCCEHVCAHLLDLFLAEAVFQTAKETLQELQCFCKYLQRWREAVAARKKLRRQMRAFPAAPCCVDMNARLQALAPSAECPITRENLAKGLLDLGHAGRVGVSCTRLRWLRNKTAHQMKVQHFHSLLLRSAPPGPWLPPGCPVPWARPRPLGLAALARPLGTGPSPLCSCSDAAWAPLDLPSLVAEHLPALRECVFWKLVLVLPDGAELPPGSPGRALANWLKVKFVGDGSAAADVPADVPGVRTLALTHSRGSSGGRAVSVNVCVKVAHGVLSDRALDAVETQRELLGASGLLLLLPPKERRGDAVEESMYWLSALLRLRHLLEAKPFQPALPLAVLVPGLGAANAKKDVEDGLMLRDLVSAELVSDYTVLGMPDTVSDAQGTAKVSRAVQWLLTRCPRTLDLCCQTLVQFVEDGVSREFSGRFFHDRRERRRGGLASQEPGAVVELFNSVLRFLAAAASSPQLCDLSWPVAEFARAGGSRLLPHLRWNSPEHLAWLKQAVLGFQLPQVDLPPPGAPWLPVCAMVVQYASQIPSSRQTRPMLQSQVESLLRRTYLRWRGRSPAPDRAAGPSASQVPWDDVIALCIHHKLRDWTPPRLPVVPEALSEDGQVCVYFFKSDLKKYGVPPSWEQARTQTRKELQLGQGRSAARSFLPSANELSALSPPECRRGLRSPKPSTEGLPGGGGELLRGASAQELLTQCLSRGLLLEKEESRRFEDQLQQWLSEDSGAHPEPPALPLYLPQTLVSLPQTLGLGLRPAASPQPRGGTRERERPAAATGTSLTERLEHLERLIRSSREESAATELHLSALLDMVDI